MISIFNINKYKDHWYSMTWCLVLQLSVEESLVQLPWISYYQIILKQHYWYNPLVNIYFGDTKHIPKLTSLSLSFLSLHKLHLVCINMWAVLVASTFAAAFWTTVLIQTKSTPHSCFLTRNNPPPPQTRVRIRRRTQTQNLFWIAFKY